MNWLNDNIIYVTKHGSFAYGTNTELSDLDIKGICIPPKEIESHLFLKFEQAENNEKFNLKYLYLTNPKNPKIDSVIYSLKKIFILSSNCNPNCLELFFTDEVDHIFITPIMEKLLENRDLFISSRAKFTFSGYAYAQLAKIERHRKWIVKGEIKKPTREDFGLKSESLKQFEDVFRFLNKKVEEWNLSQYPLDELQRSDLFEKIWEIVYNLTNKKVNWDNWPHIYKLGAINNLRESLDLKEEIIDLIKRELAYRTAKQEYDSWLTWKNNRNQLRKILEEKCGYDSKHASQLVRLLKMGIEILETGKVIVKRPDAQELLFIKNGGWSYEKIIEYAENAQKRLDDLYKTTKLPKSVDYLKINELYLKILENC